ncbi:uncharacterized protein AB675_4422 [Cyphellophora attinorum]|uniref:Uncharacterized protein n=1 Tax=Cyphellophora attinorum TaxID=1664694 RepID=A0A0N1H404_9EURO|nr:uncharacterized protein AB675_4422 [Phialophora attinorum]KPI36595.1 hypothetical protein AB675_4422 [Phialophora attinorum]
MPLSFGALTTLPVHETPWINITIKRSGRKPLDVLPQTAGQALIPHISANHVRDYIWDEFDSLMSEVELKRANVASAGHGKGALKSEAPIPWLSWTTSSGKNGQTRNRNNFCKIWKVNVEHLLIMGFRCRVSSVLLPRDLSSMSIAVDFPGSCDSGRGVKPMALTTHRPRCDSGVAFDRLMNERPSDISALSLNPSSAAAFAIGLGEVRHYGVSPNAGAIWLETCIRRAPKQPP